MILGLNGYIGAGKNTVANIIENNFPNLNVEQRSVAGPMKKSAAAALGIDVEVLEEYKNDGLITLHLGPQNTHTATSTITFRQYIQQYGTEAHRNIFGTDFWLNELLPFRTHPDKIFIVTDVRFDNEARYIRNRDGFIWQIGSGDSESTHVSEHLLDEQYVDYYIDNEEKNMELLKDRVVTTFQENYDRFRN